MRITLVPSLLLLSMPAAFAGVNPPAPGIETAAASNSLGMLDLRAGNLKSAEAHFRQAVSLAGNTLGESQPDTAFYETHLALALLMQGQNSRAEVLLHRARHIIETASSPDPRRLSMVLGELAAVEANEKQFPRAEADALQALTLITPIEEPGSLETSVYQVVLAAIYLQEHKLDEAEKILPNAVARERQLAAASQSDNRRELAHGIRRLAELRSLQHNWQEAQALYSEAIELFESGAGPRDPAFAPMLTEYAAVLKHTGASPSAVKAVQDRLKAMHA